MSLTDSGASPLERVPEKLDEKTIEALKVLSDETRIAILLAFWEEYDPNDLPRGRPELSFSELRQRVGVADSGRFNYHLDKLSDVFIERSSDGYKPLYSVVILNSLMSRRLAEPDSFESEPIDAECWRCGSSVVIDYHDNCLVERCTDCEGVFHKEDGPSGVLSTSIVPSCGLEYQTPQEFHRNVNVKSRTQLESRVAGICPRCSGPVSATLHQCAAHDEPDGAPCESCGSIHELTWVFACDVCKAPHETGGFFPALFESDVQLFFATHGLDVRALYDASRNKPIYDAVRTVELTASDPPTVEVTFELDGDRLTAVFEGGELVNSDAQRVSP